MCLFWRCAEGGGGVGGKYNDVSRMKSRVEYDHSLMKHGSVSRQKSTDSIINPHDYYPLNPKRYNLNACAPALTQESKLHVNRSKSKDLGSLKYKLSMDNSLLPKCHYDPMQASSSSCNDNMGPLRVSYQRQGSSRSLHAHRQISAASTIAAANTSTMAHNNNFISGNNTGHGQFVNSNINNNLRLNVSMLYSFI